MDLLRARVLDPVRIREMTPEERALLLSRVLDDHPHLAELILAELIPERLRPVGG